MITEITISNFKSIKNQTISDIPQIVAIWGYNGSGKSSLLQAITWVMKNKGQLGINGLLFSSYSDITYGHDISTPCSVYVTYKGIEYAHIVQEGNVKGSSFPKDGICDSIRCFPPWRSILSRSHDVKDLTRSELAFSGSRIHPFIYDFFHRLNYKIRSNDPEAIALLKNMNTHLTNRTFAFFN